MGGKIDESCLIVRNFPVSYTEKDIYEFLQMFDAKQLSIFIAHRLAVVEFDNKNHARDILLLLHQEILDENRLFVEYAPKNRQKMCFNLMTNESSSSSQHQHHSNAFDKTIDETSLSIADGLKRLYATAENLNINQPPPPYLRYEYPKVNRDIIDAIAIGLECIPKFYVQVLHLMNRMNLEPPFVPGDKRLNYESASGKTKCATISTQTDDTMWQHTLRSKRKLIESDESELESNTSSDSDAVLNAVKRKRKRFNAKETPKNYKVESVLLENLRQKQRKSLKMQQLQNQTKSNVDKQTSSIAHTHRVSEAFEAAEIKTSTIKIRMPNQLDALPTDGPNFKCTDDENAQAMAANISVNEEHSTALWNDSKLNENRIPSDQLKVYPMFQNYAPGDISNRLYIKNIAKEVTESDLKAIYERYLAVNCGGNGNIQSIDIRLMTTGRMKGQAFINFEGPYLNCDVDDEATQDLPIKYRMIEKALNETNGLILKGKPLVVVYGKKK